MTPRLSELKDRVRFERRGAASNVGGVVTAAWATLIDSRFCSLRPSRAGAGGEAAMAARMQGTGIFDLWVRGDSAIFGVTTADRVVDARNPARTFNIRWIGDLVGDGDFILMQLEQGGSDG